MVNSVYVKARALTMVTLLATVGLVCDPVGVSDLPQLRRAAEDLAKSRKERPTTGHALVVLGDSEGPAQVLLHERGLKRETLLQAVRVAEDDGVNQLSEAWTRARELAARTPQASTRRDVSAQGAAGVHLLFALCQEPKSAAYRMLAQVGVDIGKMRTQAMQIALGVLSPPRAKPAQVSAARGARIGEPTVAMPLRPPVRELPTRVANKAPAEGARDNRPETLGGARADSTNANVDTRALLDGADRAQSKPARSLQNTPKSKPRRREPRAKSTLARLAVAWSEQVQSGATRPLGRAREVHRALDALAKLAGNNPCFVGAAGVGKTSAALAVTFALAHDDIEVWMLSAQALLAKCGRGELAARLATLESELESERTVLVLDDLPAFFAPEAGDEIAAFARRMLEKHSVPCLLTGETSAMRALEGREPTVVRNLLTIELDELSHAETLEILEGRKSALSTHHGVRLESEVLERAVTMTARYLPKGALAERALHLVDLAAARAHRLGQSVLEASTLASVVSELSQVPEDRVLETDQARMLKLEALVGERLVGHEEAVTRIARVLRRNATGMGGARPIGVFLLLGPTGVGKTETAKAVAECMFHSEHAMTRLDLSEYAESHAVARLVGAPPGYVGHEAGGQLTSAVRKRPHQVVLLDEIEKAHRDVLEAFLAVFDEGIMTDGRGVTVSFENTVIFLTSNLGADAAPVQSARIGFGARSESTPDQSYATRVLEAARAGLPPELWNRFDDVLVFPALSRAAVHDIAKKMLAKLAARMHARHRITLSVSEAAIEHLLDAGGFEPQYGARPVRRAIARLIEAELAERVLRGEIGQGDRVRIERAGRGLDFVRDRGVTALAG